MGCKMRNQIAASVKTRKTYIKSSIYKKNDLSDYIVNKYTFNDTHLGPSGWCD